MNVQLPGRLKGYKKRIIIYAIILTICVFSIGIAIYQLFEGEKLEVIVGITKSENEEIEELKTKFNSIFNNNIENQTELEDYNNIVYTQYKKQEKSTNNFDLNVNIPYININSATAMKYNSQIKEDFEESAKFIQQTQFRNISYTVNYMAYIDNNILSLAILSTFKEGSSAQRTMLKTYNYDLINNTEVSLNDLISLNNLKEDEVQNQIEIEIKKTQEQIEELRTMGYEIYARNVNDDMYKLENTKDFFMYKDHLYIVYAYGNNNNTSEMDIVII